MADMTVTELSPGLSLGDQDAVLQKATQQGHLAEHEAAEILEVAGDDVEQIDEVITDLARNEVKVEEEQEEEEE